MIEDIKKVQEYLKQNDIDAYLIFSSDPHCSEYMVDKFRTIRFFSSFTGSAGTLLITKNESLLWTDGRYFIQAKSELASTNTILMKMGEDNIPSVFEYIKNYKKIALDFETTSIQNINDIKKENKKICLIDCPKLINNIWSNRPSMPHSKAFMLLDKDAGETIESKLIKVKKFINKHKATSALITELNDIAWLFNLRGFDIPFNMVNYAYALISNSSTTLYIDSDKLDNCIIRTLNSQNVTIKSYCCIYDDIKSINGTILIDPEYTNYLIYNNISKAKLAHPFITTILKSKKNSTEISNIKKAHILDAIAMIKFIKFVKENKSYDELSLADMLLSFRKESPDFLMPSFETICAFNSNGAIVHYTANQFTNKQISENGLLLVDSGGHYRFGTTDITRTLAIGNISNQIKHDFTLVLKAHILLASATFSKGTTGVELDAISRKYLSLENKDYKHGTGHGVGYMLSVHEGPNSISKRATSYKFTSGLITSNEPGYYLENEYGIRHENLILTKKKKDGSLYFETITLVPFDLDAIDKSMLTIEEINWLNNYHKKIYKKISPLLDSETKTYLKKITRKICLD